RGSATLTVKPGGSGSIVASDNLNMTLKNSQLNVGGGAAILSLSGLFNNATLTGGASNNTFTANSTLWTGNATINGGGGTDTLSDPLIAASATGVTFDSAGVTINGTKEFTLSGIANLTLTGSTGDDTFTDDGWGTGTVT